MDAKVLQDARNFLRGFRSAVAFAEAVDGLANLEASMAAAKDAYEGVLVETQNAKGELEVIRAECARAHEENDALRGEARKEAKRLKEQASVAATAKLKKCEEDCATLVQNAKNEASSMDQRVAHAQHEVEKAQAELATVNGQLADAKAQLDELLARFK